MLTTLRSPDGALARMTAHGAQVASWQPAGQPERLFLSAASPIDAGVALRGGVPVIFPQFSGMGPLVKHGFARNQRWTLQQQTAAERVMFVLTDNDATRAAWPFRFRAELVVAIGGDLLTVTLTVHNTDQQALTFTAALHTYLRVDHIDTTHLRGLQGVQYRDSLAGGVEATDQAPEVSFREPCDRIYLDAPSPLRLEQPGHHFILHSSGFADAVVWNPGKQLSDSMADMEPHGYQRMVCVEAAQIGKPVLLAPGQSWTGSQQIRSVQS